MIDFDVFGRRSPALDASTNLSTRWGLGLLQVGSSYSLEDQTISDSIFPGDSSARAIRMVTFARILKYQTFPLAALLRRIIKLAEWGMASPVEIEFAVNQSRTPNEMVRRWAAEVGRGVGEVGGVSRGVGWLVAVAVG